jgi:hypothetical protein
MLVCALFTHFAHETADAARIRHSLLPHFVRDNEMQTSGSSCRENADEYLQSPLVRNDGLPTGFIPA